jgi:putative tryptophan/tyrosine transport system substrate-binding protein
VCPRLSPKTPEFPDARRKTRATAERDQQIRSLLAEDLRLLDREAQGGREVAAMTGRPARLVILAALGLGLLAAPLTAEGQQPGKVPRIGFLANTRSPGTEAFQKGLELGYVEGQNIIVEWRLAEGRLQRLPELAAELVRLKVDVLFALVPDPVKTGLVASLARPGGNITGLTNNLIEVQGKRVQLLKEAIPGLVRVAVLTTGAEDEVREVERAAASLGIQRDVVTVARPEELDQAFMLMKAKRVGAVLEMSRPIIYAHRQRIADLAIQTGLPMMCAAKEYVEAGCFFYYGASSTDNLRRSARYVDKIFKGAKPADLPVEQPTKFELVINLKTAKALGLTIPPPLLGRADEVIQ